MYQEWSPRMDASQSITLGFHLEPLTPASCPVVGWASDDGTSGRLQGNKACGWRWRSVEGRERYPINTTVGGRVRNFDSSLGFGWAFLKASRPY